MKHLTLLTFALLATSLNAQFGGFDIKKITEGTGKIIKGATGIGYNEEMAIGGSVALEIVAAHGGLWKDPAATQRVNLIGKACALNSDRPNLKYRFGITNSSSINAVSAPGGYVFITKGAYQAAANDDQLAGVLGHEIAHIAARHALRIISRNEFISGAAQVASGSSSDFRQYDVGVGNISKTALKFGYDTKSELEADEKGAQMAYFTGYDKDGLLNFLKKIEAQGHKQTTFSTHAKLSERIKKLGGTPAPSSKSSSTKKQEDEDEEEDDGD